MRDINVVVVERASLVGGGCSSLLEGCSGIRVLAALASDDAACNIEAWKPDVVLIELAASGGRIGGALDDVRDVCRSMADARVIVAYEDIDGNELLDCLLAGAKGCIHWSMLPSHLEKAVRVVHQGEAWVSRRMVADLIDRFCRIAGGASLAGLAPLGVGKSQTAGRENSPSQAKAQRL